MEDLFRLAKTVPIEKVIGRYVELTKRGAHFLGLCPFHNDHHLGSFVVTQKKDGGIWTCFSCGLSGDGVSFVAKMEQITNLEAAKKICEWNGILVSEDHSAKGSNRPEKAPEGIREGARRELSEKRSPEVLHAVYEAFWEAAYPLSPRFREHLLKERQISPCDLPYYFLYPGPKDRHFKEKFRKILEDTTGIKNPKEQDELLLGVPGFFRDPLGEVTFLPMRKAAIGYLTVSVDLQITGIQIRVMEPLQKGEARYRFFSSGFADGRRQAGSFGCNAGFPEDVLFPESRWVGKAVAITEGRFKAAALQKLGFFAVNMHSISNASRASEVAKKVGERYGARLFLAVLDSEDNPAVLHAAEKLKEGLKGVPLEFAVWDPRFGKGFDDVIHTGHMGEIHRVNFQEYEKRFLKKITDSGKHE